MLRHIAARLVPRQLSEEVGALLLELGRSDLVVRESAIAELAVSYAKLFGRGPGVTVVISSALARQGTREVLLGIPNIPWGAVWAEELETGDAAKLIRMFEAEVSNHKHGDIDEDLPYQMDVVTRIAKGMIVKDPETQEAAAAVLREAAELYESISAYVPDVNAGPSVADVIEEMVAREEKLADEESEEAGST